LKKRNFPGYGFGDYKQSCLLMKNKNRKENNIFCIHQPEREGQGDGPQGREGDKSQNPDQEGHV
jgi:hypothetical protein